MILTTADKSNIKFSDIIQLHELYYSTILDCRVKTCSIFTKRISEKEIAFFGDYKLLVFYTNLFMSGEKSYGAITVGKNFCEIVPFEDKKNIEVKSELLLQLSYNYKDEKHQNSNSHWELQIQGEIKISNEIGETDETPNNVVPREDQPANFDLQESVVKPFDSHVWQFEGNEDTPIEQLMDMDLESLKNMKSSPNY